MAFKKAEREKLWVKVLLTGPSGSGKSYSALRLATGLAKACGSRIAAVDTENGRIRYYADEFDFDDMQIADPFTPEKFVEAIDDAVEGGYKVLILDSSSAEWKYLNEVHDKMPGNSFTNWGKLKPRHAVFMDRILEAPIHIIVTARGKDEYVLEEKNGKQQPKKIGMGAQQEKDIEYNYTVTFNLHQDTNVAECQKDNTHLFEGRYDKLTEADGLALYNWANKGKEAEARAIHTTGIVETDIYTDIKNEINALIAKGIDKTAVTAKVKEKLGVANYNKIDDKALLEELLAELKVMEG